MCHLRSIVIPVPSTVPWPVPLYPCPRPAQKMGPANVERRTSSAPVHPPPPAPPEPPLLPHGTVNWCTLFFLRGVSLRARCPHGPLWVWPPPPRRHPGRRAMHAHARTGTSRTQGRADAASTSLASGGRPQRLSGTQPYLEPHFPSGPQSLGGNRITAAQRQLLWCYRSRFEPPQHPLATLPPHT